MRELAVWVLRGKRVADPRAGGPRQPWGGCWLLSLAASGPLGSLSPSSVQWKQPLSPRAWLLFCPQDPNHASRDLTSEPVTLLVIYLWQRTGHP